MPTGIFQQALGSILDNYADAIEGGTTWRGSGTAYRGIPGIGSNDPDLRSGDDTPITASGNGTTTSVVYASGTWAASRWARTDTPGYFLECTSATNAANVSAARRITAWTLGTKTFTTDAFPAATTSGDVFTVLQGYKRLPNQFDISTDADEGLDRMFQLRASVGEVLEYFGNGKMTFKTELEVLVRFLKAGREHDAIDSALTNMAIMRPVLTKGSSPDHRDGTYTMALLPTDGDIDEVINDSKKIVLRDKYVLLYRVDTTFA